MAGMAGKWPDPPAPTPSAALPSSRNTPFRRRIHISQTCNIGKFCLSHKATGRGYDSGWGGGWSPFTGHSHQRVRNNSSYRLARYGCVRILFTYPRVSVCGIGGKMSSGVDLSSLGSDVYQCPSKRKSKKNSDIETATLFSPKALALFITSAKYKNRKST